MISATLFYSLLLSFACVPLSWAVPRRFAFDAVAFWTIGCVAAISSATALFLLAIAFGLPLAMAAAPNAGRTPVTVALCLTVAGAFAATRFLPGWGWIGPAFLALRAIHVALEWWMDRIPAPTLRESVHYFLLLPLIPAGPIHRLPHFQHQMRRRRWDEEMFFSGLERVLFGVFSIYVIDGTLLSDLDTRLAIGLTAAPDFWADWALSALSWVRLYFVFAGATQVALGTTAMMGLKLEENFDRPWKARDLTEFWLRWHMTLSLWARDYVFRPVTALTRQPVIGLTAAMLVIGLWHEFSAYYVAWSFWQAAGIVVTRLASGPLARMQPPRFLGAIFGPVFVLAWLSAARPVLGLLGIGS